MSTKNNLTRVALKERLSAAVAAMQETDAPLEEEMTAIKEKIPAKASAETDTQNEVPESFGPLNGLGELDSAIETESIILTTGRPVLNIYNNNAELNFIDVKSEVWRGRLTAAKDQLVQVAKGVGRIELENEANYEWVGTGWLVDDSIIVTNRHVASVFGQKNGGKFVFRQGLGGKKIKASIDFLEEYGRTDELTFKITAVLHIEEDNGPDMALLRVEVNKQATKITLDTQLPVAGQQVAIIGYPAYDSRIPDVQLMQNLFGNIYDKKRLAPGLVTKSSSKEILHDCSTLGGNSGSVVINLQSGNAVGLHFAGKFLVTNYAVPAAVIKERLSRFTGKEGTPVVSPAITKPNNNNMNDNTAAGISNGQTVAAFTVPLHISITVGNIINASVAAQKNINPVTTVLPDTNAEEFFTEGVVEDYHGRIGYVPGFLGNAAKVPLPKVVDETMLNDVLKFKENGNLQTELKYQHFSVVMSESRRICIYSAVNIDGKTSVGMKRGPWRLDPRIDEGAQIMKECYGSAPKFSRGHMTRREDPIWGSANDAKQGNSDSMHVTNTVPQMQSMNAGIWLKLENYALQNARKDSMKISVFTGPYFTENDPDMYGVTIPLAFWKVIAFIHDDTKKLCATGYRISQEDFLQAEEFIYAENQTAQVSIASIEEETGLSFGKLSSVDPFEKDTELVAGGGVLENLDQIKFF